MNARIRSWLPTVTLVLIGLLSGIAWRAELECRGGWASLTWIGYFHWAVPLSVLAFLIWVVVVARVRRPLAFALALLLFVDPFLVVSLGLPLLRFSAPESRRSALDTRSLAAENP